MMAGRQCISIIKLHSVRLLQLQTSNLVRTQIPTSARCVKLSTSSSLREDSKSLKAKDPKQIALDEAAKTAEDLAHDAALKGLITVEGTADITAVSVS